VEAEAGVRPACAGGGRREVLMAESARVSKEQGGGTANKRVRKNWKRSAGTSSSGKGGVGRKKR